MSAHDMQSPSAQPRGFARVGTKLLDWNNHRTSQYARARWGKVWGQILILFTEAAVERLVKLEWNIINGQEEQLMLFKKSLEGELTMIAVAGAISAQIAITAFSLPDISQVHWIVRAFFACSLVAGVLSVHFAVMQQRSLGNLYNAPQIRSWLLATRHANLIRNSRALQQEKYKVSFAAAFLIQVSYTMLEYGVTFLIVGLALYFGYAWKGSLDTETAKPDNRNVFIVFITVTGVWSLQWAWAYFGKSIWLEPKTTSIDVEKLDQTAVVTMSGRPKATSSQSKPQESDLRVEVPAASNTLTEALREAAEYHRKSANADLEVARLLELETADAENRTA